MIEPTGTADTLRAEFDAHEGSFLLALRCDMRWDAAAFERATAAMLTYVREHEAGDTIPRWIAEGFWYMDRFVRGWSTHLSFPREHSEEYYEAAFVRLYDLAYWLFMGESPYGAGKGLDPLPPTTRSSPG